MDVPASGACAGDAAPRRKRNQLLVEQDFFTGQVPVEEAQQPVWLVQAFLVIGQVFCVPDWQVEGEEQPVKPRVATQATVRRVRMDFIRHRT